MFNKIMRIFRLIGDIPYRLRCRFKYKQYMIPLPGFGKWSWHEDYDRLMHGMMEVLRHYVEDQEPWDVHMILDGKVAELKNQVHEEGEENAKAMLDSQVNDAIEIHKVYRWWKEIRPALQKNIEDLEDKWHKMRGELKFVEVSREDDPELYEVACKFDDECRTKPVYELKTDETEEQKKESDKVFRKMIEAEERLNDQETDMLCRLIKVRGRLWT